MYAVKIKLAINHCWPVRKETGTELCRQYRSQYETQNQFIFTKLTITCFDWQMQFAVVTLFSKQCQCFPTVGMIRYTYWQSLCYMTYMYFFEVTVNASAFAIAHNQ